MINREMFFLLCLPYSEKNKTVFYRVKGPNHEQTESRHLDTPHQNHAASKLKKDEFFGTFYGQIRIIPGIFGKDYRYLYGVLHISQRTIATFRYKKAEYCDQHSMNKIHTAQEFMQYHYDGI